jgi:hypothetical protein
MEYPKINSLYKRAGMFWHEGNQKMQYDRSKSHELIIGEYALPEYGLIKHWQVFEKIDGTNIRITYEQEKPITDASKMVVRFDGRTKDSSIPSFLLRYLQDTFTVEKLSSVFQGSQRVILYGEGYGPKIQNGGSYRDAVSFIAFDIYVGSHDEAGWWLDYERRLDICKKLEIDHVPLLHSKATEQEIVDFVKLNPQSRISKDQCFRMEGIVATTDPILRLRNGQPIKFKLRCEDFE